MINKSNIFNKHLCVLFLSIALIASYISVKNKNNSKTRSKGINNSTKDTSLIIPTVNPITTEGSLNFPDNKFLNNITINDNRTSINILGLFELTTKSGIRKTGLSEMLAAQLAIKHINQFNILNNYKLNLLINDTKCDPGVGIDRFFHAIYSNKTILMLLGTSCSNVTESLAHVVPYWNILQVSYGSTSPYLSDRQKFPLFFRTITSHSSHNFAKIDFIKYFQWKVVATFCQSKNEFLLPLNKLIGPLELSNISCKASITFSFDNYKEQLKILKNADIRIIIGSFSPDIAPKIFCEIYKLGIYGAEYVWILHDYNYKWWMDDNNEFCKNVELKETIEGVIFVSDYNNIPDTETSLSGLTDEIFENNLNLSRESLSKNAKLSYDAVWAMALTLKNYLKTNNLTNFNYYNRNIIHEIVEYMNHIEFIGLSGPIKFLNGDRIGNSIFSQIQDGKIKNIAIYNSIKQKLNFFCNICEKIKWQSGKKPYAQRILKATIIKIPTFILSIIITISLCGIIIALLFLYFNLHYRRMKSVKLSSPTLNNVAVIGCIFVYTSIILLGIDRFLINSTKYFTQLCTTGVYLLSVGFSLTFGSMFAKTYRVHRIFTTKGTIKFKKNVLLKDKQLIILILIPPIIDGIIVMLWIMVDPMQKQLYNLTLELSVTEPGIVYQPQVQVCCSQNTIGWFIAIYGYKSLILIMAIFMAWETRHIKVQILNDSHHISICVYSAVFTTIIVLLSTLISEYVLFSYLARTLSILLSTTVTLILLFLPKLKSFFNNLPDGGDPIMESMGLKIEYNTRRLIGADLKEQINRLEIQNQLYRIKLKNLSEEIDYLENQLTNSLNCGNIVDIDLKCIQGALHLSGEGIFNDLKWIFDSTSGKRNYSNIEWLKTIPINNIKSNISIVEIH